MCCAYAGKTKDYTVGDPISAQPQKSFCLLNRSDYYFFFFRSLSLSTCLIHHHHTHKDEKDKQILQGFLVFFLLVIRTGGEDETKGREKKSIANYLCGKEKQKSLFDENQHPLPYTIT